MKVATQSLYRPFDKAVLRKFDDYFYGFMASLTGPGLARQNHVIDSMHGRAHKYGLKS